MPTSDTDLVVAATGGDMAGVAGMYDRYADRLHNYAWSVCRSHADASDIVQDTFITASQRLDQLRDPERLRPWLFAIARSHALRVIRQRKRVEVDSEVDMITEFAEPAGGLDAQQLVWDAADGLDAKDRDILTLHLREGLDGEDLAAALGIKANAANVALFRVRERLENAVSAVLLTRFASGECNELDTMMAGTLTPLVRKRATRHINSCEDCQEGRRRIGSPAALFAATPAALAPLALRETVLNSWGSVGLAPDATITAWHRDGFPDDPAARPTVSANAVTPVGHSAGTGAVRSARIATLVGVAAVIVGLVAFTTLRSRPDMMNSAQVTPAPTTAAPGTALAGTPATTASPTAPDPATTAAGAATTAAPAPSVVTSETADPTPTRPTASPPATDPPATEPTAPPVDTPPTGSTPPAPVAVGQPTENAPPDLAPTEPADDTVSIAVLEFECAEVIRVRLLVNGPTTPTVIVRSQRAPSAPIDVELTESPDEPNVYGGEASVFETNHRVTAIATAGDATETILLDESCSRIG